MSSDARLHILGYRARCPSGTYAYWCGECWMLCNGKVDFLMPDNPDASEPVTRESPDADTAYCFACRRYLRSGKIAD